MPNNPFRRFQVGGLDFVMTEVQAERWNNRKIVATDLVSIRFLVPVEGKKWPDSIAFCLAMNVKKSPNIARVISGEKAYPCSSQHVDAEENSAEPEPEPEPEPESTQSVQDSAVETLESSGYPCNHKPNDTNIQLYGKTRGGSQRYRCKLCGKCFTWGRPAVYHRSGKFDAVKLLVIEGKSNRAIQRELGISKHTVARYRFFIEAEFGIGRCPCGLPATHQGWCSYRYDNSPKRQAVMKKLNQNRTKISKVGISNDPTEVTLS